jgi:deoxyribose-phosphate aldolase
VNCELKTKFLLNHLFPYIERTLLRPDVPINEQYEALDEVQQLGLAGLVVAPFWVKKHRRELGDAHPAGLAVAVGYPYGYQRTEIKQHELELGFTDGANRAEVVVNTSALLSPTSVWLKIELAKLVTVAHAAEVPFIVVLESSLLTKEQQTYLIKIATDAGADGLKNGTGAHMHMAHMSGTFLLEEALAFRAAVPHSVDVSIVADGASVAEMEALVAAGVSRLALQKLP